MATAEKEHGLPDAAPQLHTVQSCEAGKEAGITSTSDIVLTLSGMLGELAPEMEALTEARHNLLTR